ncbi:unnamed protein product [Cyclocybe aegerita]|uniref:Uncharacterized protein n=1 Tax=Cyclocybe aegerita TaxID=1973307 RepID=A0A8S0W0C5_CYCAE|nr:unnamed protein product [Cyclocybe aegerita]
MHSPNLSRNEPPPTPTPEGTKAAKINGSTPPPVPALCLRVGIVSAVEDDEERDEVQEVLRTLNREIAKAYEDLQGELKIIGTVLTACFEKGSWSRIANHLHALILVLIARLAPHVDGACGEDAQHPVRSTINGLSPTTRNHRPRTEAYNGVGRTPDMKKEVELSAASMVSDPLVVIPDG